MILDRLCSIQMGYTTRGSHQPDEQGSVVVQLRDAPIAGPLRRGVLARLQLQGVDERYEVTEGDIIFRSRGEYPAAFYLGCEWQEPVIAVYPFMILRADRSKIIPEYLVWSINQVPARRYFERESQGTTIMAINKRSLANLEIPVPSLETQTKIVELAMLQEREVDLLRKLADTKSKMTTALLIEKAKKPSL